MIFIIIFFGFEFLSEAHLFSVQSFFLLQCIFGGDSQSFELIKKLNIRRNGNAEKIVFCSQMKKEIQKENLGEINLLVFFHFSYLIFIVISL